jgi:hypothetical protein
LTNASTQYKIVLFKIPQGDLKEDNTKFLGNIIFSKLMMAFMSRTPEEMKHETLMIADEVQNFVTTNPKDFELLMDELRKYGVCFVMAHQRVPQIQSIISAVRDTLEQPYVSGLVRRVLIYAEKL